MGKGKKKQQKKTPGDNESQETSGSQSLESSVSQSREPSTSRSQESSALQSRESSAPQSQGQRSSSKGRKKKQRDSHTPGVEQQQQSHEPRVEQQPGGPPMQQPRGPPMQQPRGPPMQQPRGPPMQQPRGPPMQQPRGPPMQQPRGPPMQQPRGPPMQQPRGPPMQQPRGPPMQQPCGPPMQQQPQGLHVQQQQQPQGPQVLQQQQQPHGPQMQQPYGPQMQQPHGPPMQQPRGPQMQQPRGPPIQRAWGPQVQQQPQGLHVQQQQQPQGPQVLQQQQQPHGPQMQQPYGPQMQQPYGPQMQQPHGPPIQQRAWGPQVQQQPQGPQVQQQQQPQGPQVLQQQQQPQGPPVQQQQQPQRPPVQQQQQPQGPQVLQQQQQPQGPPVQQQQQPQGPPVQQQQQPQRPPVQQQQQPQRPPVQQQQQPQRPPVQQQQQPQGPPVQQQQQPQRPPVQQQQQPQGPPVQQQQQQQQQQQKSQVKQQQKPQSAKAQQRQPPPIESPSMSAVAVQKSKVSMPSHLMESYLEKIPRRKNPNVCGKAGTPIFVETNMFKIVFGSKFQTNVIHYDVAMDPDRPKQLMRPVFEQFRKKHFPKRYPAFDGKKNAYSANDLPFGDTMEDSVQIFDDERQQLRTYKVKLTKAAVVDLSWLKSVKPGSSVFQNGIQALDVILRHGPSSAMVTVGRSLFQQPTGRVVSLSSGLDLWVGVFQSAVIGWKPYLNIDVAHKGFPSPQNVIDLMKELCQNPRYNDNKEVGPADIRRNETKITKFLKGLKVQYEIPGQSKRTQRVNGLGECAKTNKFTLSNGKVCTVQQYFAQEKRYNIRFPELPCLWIGSREKKIYVPAELCTIVAGQVVQKKMDEVQTTKMIREAATDTNIRKEKIKNGFASLRLNESPVVTNEFQLSVQGQFEKVPARVLSPPVLQYHGREVRVSRGVWHAGHFYSPSKLDDKTWTILNLNDRYTQDRDMYFLQERLQQAGNSVNIKIGSAQTPFTTLSSQGPRYVQNIQTYFQAKKDEGLQLVVVIIPDHVDAYSKVKQITELRVGVLTQCIRAQTLRKLSDATVTNILLKINSKLNGVNHIFGPRTRPGCLESPCILIGADVTHPSPDAIDVPSIAAVAASHDPSGTKYNIEIRLQPPREEMILDLEEIMREQLIFFYKKTNHKPNKIIFYRDGVGDGHLPAVMHFELQAIKRACQRLQADYNPPVTFLVVQKRHHIRLFPTDRKYSDDRNFNVQAGTIVDTEITHPSHIDFYLVSHASIQGTARPTKYKCICNENNLSEDEIEQLTYYLCHIFARCTRSVSYPAPTYYAHLAAFRARALTHEVHLQLDNLKEEQRTKMNLQIHKTTPMFFV